MELTSDNSNGIETNKTEENGRTSGENTPSFSYSENTPTLPSSSEVPPRGLCESKKIHPFEDNYAFYANPEIYKKVKDLLVTRCKQCKQTFQTKKDLVTHFKSKHSSLLCSTCLDNNHQFWYEYSNYAPDALTNHRKGLLNESGFFGHIYCYFCSFYLYNRDTAKIHCNQEHYLCTVCDILNVKFQYYKDFESLHAHYRSKHFCCSNSVCRSNLCYVYAYKSELWAHAMTNHGLEMNLSDICLGNEANPPVFSLFEKGQEQDEESLYGTDSNITNPLISNPFFPKFSSNTTDGSSNDSRQNVPVFLNRQIIHQEDSVSKQRINQVKYITSNFYAEISDSIGKYISGRKAVEDMVKEIEDCVGKQICLKILEGVPFYSKQKQIRDFSEGYKKELTFPTFKKTTEKVKENKKQKTGFRILDSSKFK